jgi:dienelactone hydrolase
MKPSAIMSVAILSVALQTQATAAIKTETVEYKHGDVVLEGYLAYDDAITGKRPGVLVVHEWKGLGAHAKHSAEELARLGYVAFAVDMYGKGVRPQTNQEAAAEAGKYKNDRALMRARINTGLDQLKSYSTVDPQRIAAIGYCFGGTTVLELARSGADVAGVVSFHGGLDSPAPADGKNIKAKVLVLHGADDPYVPAADIAAFQDELRKAGVDWRMIYYGGAVHSFTNPEAGTDNSKGAAYNERAANRSWEAMKAFFVEIFR